MSWLEKHENIQFSITTGDGREYNPLLTEIEKSKEYNTSVFDFIDVPGSLIERKNPKGGKYPLTFYFQGEDCLTISDNFENSADDRRYWTVVHPVYGTIKGQPISISRNDNNLNVVAFKVDFFETIVFDFPYSNINVQDNVLYKKDEFLFSAAKSFSSKQSSFKTEDIQRLKQTNTTISSSFESVQTNNTYSEYLTALSEGQKASDKLRVNAIDAVLCTQKLINDPSMYDQQVVPRLNSYKTLFNNFDKLMDSVFGKSNYESNAGAVIACACNTVVNFDAENDYKLKTQVDQVITDLTSMYNEYVSVLDSATTSNDNFNGQNWQPSPEVQMQLNQLILYTISEVYNLAFDAMQERVVYLDKESNIILLTHKYYGLASDQNINSFCTINNIVLNERFKLKKGRKIKYYR